MSRQNSPTSKQVNAGKARDSSRRGCATSTGTNWSNAPHINRLSQPIVIM